MKVKNNTQSKEALVDTPIPSRYAEQLRNKKGEWYFPGGILTYMSQKQVLQSYSNFMALLRIRLRAL